MYHFFITPDDVTDNTVTIRGADVNHIKNVLRMGIGDEILVSDGAGSDLHCRISVIEDEGIECEVIGKAEDGSELPARVFLFQCLPKQDKFETVIQKSVELGVHEIIPVASERCVVKYDEKKKKAKRERWNKISEGAAKQSHRGMIPEIKEVMAFSEALAYAVELTADGGLFVIPYENYKDMKETKNIISGIRPGMNIAVFVGPEGGFAPEEVEKAISAGASQISLGNRILRTETAPLMILSVIGFQLEE